MDRRRFPLTSLASLLTRPGAAEARSSFKLPRIGFLGLPSESSLRHQMDAFRAGLRDLGYVEGKNIVIEYRWADGEYERLSDLAGELVRLPVDVLVTHGTPGGFAAKRATTTIPIVIATSADAVASGLVDSLARPGGNVTGLTFFVSELNGKRLEIFRDVLPHASRMAVLVNPGDSAMGPIMQAMERTASALRVGLQQYPVRGPDHFDNTLSAMITKSRILCSKATRASLLDLPLKSGCLPSVLASLPGPAVWWDMA